MVAEINYMSQSLCARIHVYTDMHLAMHSQKVRGGRGGAFIVKYCSSRALLALREGFFAKSKALTEWLGYLLIKMPKKS